MFENKNKIANSLQWLIPLVLTSAVGCAANAEAADVEADTGAQEQAATATPATTAPAPVVEVFLNTSTMDGSQTDWDVGRGKAECAPGSAIVGMSEIEGGPARVALCQASTPSLAPSTVVSTLLFTGGNQQLASRGGDWAPGFIKYECGIGQYVSGVSEDAFENQSNTFFHGIQCSQGTIGTNEVCTAHVFDNGDSRGSQTDGDWDPGDFKAQCADGEYAVGVSGGGHSGPHSLYCCSSH